MNMQNLLRHFAACAILAVGITSCASADDPTDVEGKVSFAANLDHSAWDGLLKKYVDERGLVDYGGLKNNAADLAILDGYLADFAKVPKKAAKGDDYAAAATNAYNAFAIRDMITAYPTKSIMKENNAFTKKTHLIAGKMVSLDEIEKKNVLPVIGWKGHGIVVCCAMSCPPLQRFAYTGKDLDEQVDIAFTAWMGRSDLNQYFPDKNAVKISKIYDWYKDDFQEGPGTRKILATYAPEKDKAFLSGTDYKIGFLKYNWDLNDQK